MTDRRELHRRASAVAGAAVVVLAVWLGCVPWMWRYDGVSPGFDARVNDVAVAVVLGVFGLAWSARLLTTAVVRLVGLVTGGWLLVAPLVLDYGLVTESTLASVNDVLVGAAVISLSFAATVERRRKVVPHSRRGD